MPDDHPIFCDGPQRDEETVELTAEAPLPAAPSPRPEVMTDFDWLDRPESNALLNTFQIRQAHTR